MKDYDKRIETLEERVVELIKLVNELDKEIGNMTRDIGSLKAITYDLDHTVIEHTQLPDAHNPGTMHRKKK